MAYVQLGYQNTVTTAAITPSTASVVATQLPSSNLQNDQGSPSYGWQTALPASGQSDAGLTFIPAVPTRLTVLSLHRTNLTANATVTIVRRATATTNVNATALDQQTFNAAPYRGQSVFIMPDVGLVGSYDVYVSDRANPDGFVNIPLMYCGPTWAPMRNLSFNSSNGRNVGIDDTQTRGGQEFPNYRWTQRTYKADFQNVKDAEVWPYLDVLDAYARTGANALLIPDPKSVTVNNEAVFGRLTAITDLARTQSAYGNRQWQTVFTERL